MPYSSNTMLDDAPPIHQTGLRKRLNNNLITKKQTELKPTFNVDHNGGCKVTININGVPNNQVHINEQADHSISYFQNKSHRNMT